MVNNSADEVAQMSNNNFDLIMSNEEKNAEMAKFIKGKEMSDYKAAL